MVESAYPLKMAESSSMECGDYLEFQDRLQKMRQLDDKILYLLNTAIPTESFKGQVDPTAQCKDLFKQIQSGHSQRTIAIKKCIDIKTQRVRKLKEVNDIKPDDDALKINLRKEQRILRLLESELDVEKVIQSRTSAAYHTKCRGFYKPEK